MMEFIVIFMGVVIGGVGYHIYITTKGCSPKAGTQARAVLAHLKKNKNLTAKEAKELYSIGALRSVVCRLRSAGYEIQTKRNGHIAIYSMK
jgi:hypothetical protein